MHRFKVEHRSYPQLVGLIYGSIGAAASFRGSIGFNPS